MVPTGNRIQISARPESHSQARTWRLVHSVVRGSRGSGRSDRLFFLLEPWCRSLEEADELPRLHVAEQGSDTKSSWLCGGWDFFMVAAALSALQFVHGVSVSDRACACNTK